MDRIKDSHARSLIKGMTWRITALMDTVLIAWLITGNVSTAFKIGGIEIITKVFLFYLHERVWGRIQWRRKETEAHRRSLAKATSWRIIGSADTTAISWIVTKDFRNAMGIGSVEVVTKISLFYLHERLWSLIPWGARKTESAFEFTPDPEMISHPVA